MPDLGKYAVEVASAYAASIVLILILVGVSIWRNNRMRAALRSVEERQRKTNG